jgi:hypothetical protein
MSHATPANSESDYEYCYEPEYEMETIQVTRNLQLCVLSIVPPPIEFLCNLRADQKEISSRRVWTGSLLLAQVFCQIVSKDSGDAANNLLNGKRYVGTQPRVTCLAQID